MVAQRAPWPFRSQRQWPVPIKANRRCRQPNGPRARSVDDNEQRKVSLHGGRGVKQRCDDIHQCGRSPVRPASRALHPPFRPRVSTSRRTLTRDAGRLRADRFDGSRGNHMTTPRRRASSRSEGRGPLPMAFESFEDPQLFEDKYIRQTGNSAA